MIARIVVLIRALSGGEVEDRAVVRLARSLRGEDRSPALLVETLTRAVEQLGEARRASEERGRFGLALALIFGASGAISGLHGLSGLAGDPRPLLVMLPVAGLLAGFFSIASQAWPDRRRSGREAALIAHLLAGIGVSTVVALDVALYAAGGAASQLRAGLERAPIDEGVVPDRARAALAVLASELIADPASPLARRRTRGRRLAIAGAVWVACAFWIAYFWVLSDGFSKGLL